MAIETSSNDDKETRESPSAKPPRHSIDTDEGAPEDQPNPGDPGPAVLKPSEKDRFGR